MSCRDAGDHQVGDAPARLAAAGYHLGGDEPVLPGGLLIERQRAEGRFDSLQAENPPGAFHGIRGRVHDR
jgi:hypothetical protein